MLSRARRLPLWASGGACWLLMCASLARAQPAGDNYERLRVEQYLGSTGLREDPAPEGKRIRRLQLVRREVFEGDDLLVPVVLPTFASTWPNLFHAVTRESIIRRELLLHEGDVYSAELAEESMRNLRGLGVLALVRVVPLATDEPGAIDLLVYTRDLWSLRLEQQFSGAGSSFELAAQLIERNFLGLNKSLAARFSLAPDIYTFGQTYVDPRVLGGDLRLSESFDVIFNRDHETPEGSTAGLYFGRPFYNIAQRFGFDVNLAYADFVWRDLRDGEVLGYDTRPGSVHGQDCEIGTESCIPLVWDEWRFRLDAAVHFRAGVTYTQTFSAGAGIYDLQTAPNAETGLRESQEQVFYAEVLPPDRRDVYPFVRYRLSLPRFVVFTNLGTYGLSESVQIGPQLDASLLVPLEALGSTGTGLSAHGAATYILAGADMLAQLSAEVWTRLDRGDVVDQRAFVQLRAAGPAWPWLWGRLIMRTYWDGRRNDTQRTLVTLGGDNGLRGYPAQYLFGRGASRVLWNFEYRTLPWMLQSIHFGFVGFYDAGAVYADTSQIDVHHGIGVGARVLFPQFNRSVFRLDVGHALGEPGFSVLLSYGGDQMVPLTQAEDAAAANGLGPSLR
jgi:hypothetical protein